MLKYPVLKILLLITISGCFKKQSEENINKIMNASSITEQIEIAYQLRNDSLFSKICDLLNDTINSAKNIYALHAWLSINYEEEISWRFLKYENKYFPNMTENNCFIVKIRNIDTIFISGKKSFPDKTGEAIRTFYKKQEDSIGNKEELDINFFGKVSIPDVGNLLTLRVKKGNGLAIDEWKIFFKCMHEIISFYEDRRNEIAIKRWGIAYDEICYDKKIAVNELVHFKMFIIFFIDP